MIKVGDRFESAKGDFCVVIDYINTKNITVQFEDNYKHRAKVTETQLKRGWIKNPYKPLLFNVGYFGVGIHKSKDDSSSDGFTRLPAYSAWANMLSRCYDKNYNSLHVYKNTTVHEEWHCFQTFADWYTKELSYSGWAGDNYLDKDIIGDGSIYSHKHCCLVPACINTILTTKHGGIYLQGVSKSTNGLYRVTAGYLCSNDRFTTEESAHLAFVEAKSEKIKQLANEYQRFLRPNVYETLMTKDFRFKFSPFFQKPETHTGSE